MSKDVKIKLNQKKILKTITDAAEKKADAIRHERESSSKQDTDFPGFYQQSNQGFPYTSQEETISYGKYRIMCPNCLKVIGVKIGTNNCPLCDHLIEVTENSHFLD